LIHLLDQRYPVRQKRKNRLGGRFFRRYSELALFVPGNGSVREAATQRPN